MNEKNIKTTGAENIRWDLKDLFSGIDDPKVAVDWSAGEVEAMQFVQDFKGRISLLPAADLKQAFARLETIYARLYRLGEYSALLYATDTGSEKFKAFDLKVREENVRIRNLLLFFDLELGQLQPGSMEQHIQHPDLAPYAYYLRRKQEAARYDLSEPEEKLINIKDLTGAEGFKLLYEEMTSAFSFEFELQGEKKRLTGEELRALRQHADPEVRRRAMNLFFRAYQDQRLILGSIFNNVIKDYNLERKLRGYSSPIGVQNVQNDLSDVTVETLHAVTTKSYALVQRYYALKARMLKLPDMTLADIYAPMPQAGKEFSFQEAKSLVLEAFKRFDQDFYAKALSMFEEQRIDAPAIPGKRGGAFCSSSIPAIKPFVLLNFLGRLRDVSTLAHELGHAIHSLYSQKQNLFNFHAPLPLAETASVFSEMLLTEHLLHIESDRDLKISLLSSKLEEIFATSHRQNMFSRFEQAMHNRITDSMLGTEELCAIYRQELKLMFGESVRITDEYSWEWSAIPHMVEMPFYVYAYNFANLLVMALFQQYKEQGQVFIPKFKQMLAMGGGASPQDIAGMANADIRRPEFWEKSLLVIENMINELETLIA